MKKPIDTSRMTPAEIRQAAYRAIVNELGPSGFLRFIQDSYRGHGNYTKERREFLPHGNVHEIAKEVIAWKEGQENKPSPR